MGDALLFGQISKLELPQLIGANRLQLVDRHGRFGRPEKRMMRHGVLLVLCSISVVWSLKERNLDRDGAQLLAWATRHGAQLSAVELHHSVEGGVSLRASRDISPDEAFLAVPKRLAMCGALATETFGVDTIQRLIDDVVNKDSSSIGHDLKVTDNRYNTIRNDLMVTIALLVESSRGKTSFWHDYINMLPREALALHKATVEDVGVVLDGMLVADGWREAAQQRHWVAEATQIVSLNLTLNGPYLWPSHP